MLSHNILLLFSWLLGLKTIKTKGSYGRSAIGIFNRGDNIPDLFYHDEKQKIAISKKIGVIPDIIYSGHGVIEQHRPVVGDIVKYDGLDWIVKYEKKGKMNSMEIAELLPNGNEGRLINVDYASDIKKENKKNPYFLRWDIKTLKYSPPNNQQRGYFSYKIAAKITKNSFITLEDIITNPFSNYI